MQIGPKPDARHPWGHAETPFAAMGADDGVRALAWAFYDEVEATSPTLRALLPRDTSVSRQKLYEFLSGWSGGPPLYWERRGHPALRMRHAPFPIDDHAVSEWLRCMEAALDQRGVAGELRTFLSAEFERMAVHLRNQDPPEPHE